MASEIRANKQTNRVGLGTVTYTDTGIIVSGIVTANSLGGIGHIDVGSNIKIGNAGVITATSFIGSGAALTGIDASAIKFGGVVKAQANAAGVVVTGILTATSFSGTVPSSSLSGALPAISGANLTNLPPSAPVGGASTNTVFFENDKAVAVNYQITSTKNAMSAGPIAINAGIAVTVPSGCSWTIV